MGEMRFFTALKVKQRKRWYILSYLRQKILNAGDKILQGPVMQLTTCVRLVSREDRRAQQNCVQFDRGPARFWQHLWQWSSWCNPGCL